MTQREENMKVKNKNISAINTEKNIKEAFAILMAKKKELSAITVTDLVKIAGITRSSFYTHYDNIYEVAKSIQDDTLSLIDFDEIDIDNPEKIKHYLEKVVNYLKENEEIYKLILSSRDPLVFVDRLNKMIYEKIDNIIVTKDKNKELKITFFTEGCINLFVKYFRGGLSKSLDEIGEYIDATAEGFLQEYFKKSI